MSLEEKLGQRSFPGSIPDAALKLLLSERDVKAAADIRIDTISTDAVVSYGWDEKRAADTVARFKRFLDERRDELAALQILYGCPMRNGG